MIHGSVIHRLMVHFGMVHRGMVHRLMIHRRMVHCLHLAMVHLRMIHVGMAVVPIGGDGFARLRNGRTRSLGHRVAHGAMACSFLLAFGLGR